MRFRFQAAVTVVARFTAVFLMFIASVVIARELEPQGKGIIAALVAFMTIAIQFGNLGIYASIIRYVSEDKKLYSRFAGNSLTLAIFFGVMLILIITVLAFFAPHLFGEIKRQYVLIYALSLPFSLLTIFMQGLFLSVNRIKLYSLLIAFRAAVVLGGVLGIIYLIGGGIAEVVYWLVAVEVIISLIYLLSSQSYDRFKPELDFSLMRKMVGYSLKVYAAMQFSYLVLKFDQVLVNFYLGVAPEGVYSISAQLADLMYLAPATVALVFFPRATELGAKSRGFANQVLLGTTIFMLAAGILAYTLAGPFISMVFGQAYVGAINPFKLLLPGIIFISLETIIMNYYASKDMPLFVVLVPFLGLLLNIVLNIFFIPEYGILAAAASSTISYTLMFILLAAYYFKRN